MKKIIISAISLNNVIGKNNRIPWKNQEELNYFKETTLNYAVLMGRRTFDSLNKPLPKRFNLVISREEYINDKPNNLFYFTSLSEAIIHADNLNVDKLFIIGGSEVYSQMINEVDELLISRIPFEIEGDTYFPVINVKDWHLKEVKDFQSFKVESYLRKTD